MKYNRNVICNHSYFTVAANDSPAILFYTETPVFVTFIDSCMECWN